MTDAEAERRNVLILAARKRLAEGTWPEVMQVFGYPNVNVPRASNGAFEQLANYFADAQYANLAKFVQRLQIVEQDMEVTMSFNLSLRGRSVPGTEHPTAENVARFLMVPDILMGTRWGMRGAFDWLKDLSERVSTMLPESLQILDKVIGEAVVMLANPLRQSTIGEMLESVLGDDEENSKSSGALTVH